jgi:hypothetical protein
MGVLYDYFAAPSDEAAATALNRAPWAPSEDTPPLPPFDTVLSRIDPYVELGMLEALLTGRDYTDVIANPRHHKTVALNLECVRSVWTVPDELQAALAAADDSRLAAVTLLWTSDRGIQRTPFRPRGTCILAR